MNRRPLVVISCALVFGIGAILAMGRLTREPLGGSCRSNDDCRSGECAARVLRFGGEGGLAQSGVCTTRCDVDSDCPQGAPCTEAASSRVSSTGRVEGPSGAAKICIAEP